MVKSWLEARHFQLLLLVLIEKRIGSLGQEVSYAMIEIAFFFKSSNAGEQ